jgi:hypothetical protein
VALTLIAVCAFVAYSLGQQTAKPKSAVMNAPINATPDTLVSSGAPPPVKTEQPTQPPEVVVHPVMTAEDKVTTELVRKGGYADRIVVASLDPRTKALTLTYRSAEGDVNKNVAAEIARDALAEVSEASLVTLKALKGDKLAYMADVDRNRLAMTQTAAWQSSAAGPDAWVNYVISNEWYAVTPPSADAGEGSAFLGREN